MQDPKDLGRFDGKRPVTIDLTRLQRVFGGPTMVQAIPMDEHDPDQGDKEVKIWVPHSSYGNRLVELKILEPAASEVSEVCQGELEHRAEQIIMFDLLRPDA